jgi:hypothetical protein
VAAESDIRDVLRARIDDRWDDDHTLVVEEFGTHFGSGRADLAIVNGSLRGYEIKSDADRLDRLPSQIERYNEVFDYVSLVAALRHLERASDLVPDWWEIIEVSDSPTGRVRLRQIRRGRRNPSPDATATAMLLWRDELLNALEGLNEDRGLRSSTREELARHLAQATSIRDLGEIVRDQIRARPAWRADPARTPCGETSRRARRSSGFLARRLR